MLGKEYSVVGRATKIFLYVVFLGIPASIFGLIVFLDMVTGLTMFYRVTSNLRQIIYPEYYDETYRSDAVWPKDGSTAYQVTFNFEFKSRPYEVSRIIRCYQDVGNPLATGAFVWNSHLQHMFVPLHNGGLLIVNIPTEYCDSKNGLTLNFKSKGQMLVYLSKLDAPNKIEVLSFFDNQMVIFSTTEKQKKFNFLDTGFTVTQLFSSNIKYSQNKFDEYYQKYGGILNRHYTSSLYNFSSKSEPKTIMTSLLGYVYVYDQWKGNRKLVNFLDGKHNPTLIPRHLLKGFRLSDGSGEGVNTQIKQVLANNGHSLDKLHGHGKLRFTLKLSGKNSWELDFNRFGTIKYYPRGCDYKIGNCASKVKIKEFLGKDVINIGKLKITPPAGNTKHFPAVYLPSKRIIIQISRPNTITLRATN